MKINIASTTYQEVTLSGKQIREVVVKFIENKVSPNRYLRDREDGKYVMRDDPNWRHGSVDEEIVRKATEEDLLLFSFLDYVRNDK